MKCSWKGCKKDAYYCLIDGYLAGTCLEGNEILVYPTCSDHDSKFHKFDKNMKPNRWLRMRIKIKRKK